LLPRPEELPLRPVELLPSPEELLPKPKPLEELDPIALLDELLLNIDEPPLNIDERLDEELDACPRAVSTPPNQAIVKIANTASVHRMDRASLFSKGKNKGHGRVS
jgi:hypothetical protein